MMKWAVLIGILLAAFIVVSEMDYRDEIKRENQND